MPAGAGGGVGWGSRVARAEGKPTRSASFGALRTVRPRAGRAERRDLGKWELPGRGRPAESWPKVFSFHFLRQLLKMRRRAGLGRSCLFPLV